MPLFPQILNGLFSPKKTEIDKKNCFCFPVFICFHITFSPSPSPHFSAPSRSTALRAAAQRAPQRTRQSRSPPAERAVDAALPGRTNGHRRVSRWCPRGPGPLVTPSWRCFRLLSVGVVRSKHGMNRVWSSNVKWGKIMLNSVSDFPGPPEFRYVRSKT